MVGKGLAGPIKMQKSALRVMDIPGQMYVSELNFVITRQLPDSVVTEESKCRKNKPWEK